MLANDPVTQARIDLDDGAAGGRAARPERGRVQPLQHDRARPRGAVPGQSAGPALVGDHAVRPGDGRRRRQHRRGQVSGRADRLLHPCPHPCRQPARQGRAAHPHALRHGADLDPATAGSRCAPRTPSATGTASPTTRTMPAWRSRNDEGDRMCRAMGDKDILFLRNHGVIVARPDRRPGLRRPLLSRAHGDGAGAGDADRPAAAQYRRGAGRAHGQPDRGRGAAGLPAFRIAEAPARPGRARLAQARRPRRNTDAYRDALSPPSVACSRHVGAGARRRAIGRRRHRAPSSASSRSRPTRRSPRPRPRCSSPPTTTWRASCAAR